MKHNYSSRIIIVLVIIACFTNGFSSNNRVRNLLSQGNPTVGLSKALINVDTLVADSHYVLTYQLILKNYSIQKLQSIQVMDNLGSTFPSPVNFNVIPNSIQATGSLTPNPLYTGVNGGSIDLLVAINSTLDTVSTGNSDTITYKVVVFLNGNFGVFQNTAYTTASGPNDILLTTDNSNNGFNPDPNGNNNPNEVGENTSTPWEIQPLPVVIGLSKALTSIVPQENGTYNITYQLIVSNLGKGDLYRVEVVDNLQAVFPKPLAFRVVSVNATGNLVLDPNYDGLDVTGLLVDNLSSLSKGSKDTILLTVNVNLKGDSGYYYNSAVAVATSKDNIRITRDDSDNGSIADANNNGNPDEEGENDPTPLRLVLNKPILSVLKSVNTPTLLEDRQTYLLTYTIKVKNIGVVPITNLQVTDKLLLAFPSPVSFEIMNVITSAGISKNQNYNGIDSVFILQGEDILGINQEVMIDIVLQVKPNDAWGIYSNTAIGTGNGLEGLAYVSDTSNTSSSYDENGDGIANQSLENKATKVDLYQPTTQIFIPSGFSPNGDGVGDKLYIENKTGKSLSLEIYNRWGNLVFATEDYQNDFAGKSLEGFSTGDQLPDGCYYYLVKVKGSPDRVGNIQIKR